jgi:muconate cycloisomerase
MKITSIEIIPINQKHKGRLIFSAGPTPASDDFIILRIKTDEGIEGIGSALAFTAVPHLLVGCTREGAMHIMKDMASILIGQDPLRLSHNLGLLERATIGWFTENHYILSYFDHALYDLKGKVLNLPVYELLGGIRRESIPLEHIVSFLPTPEEVGEEAKRAIDAGFRSVKIHVSTSENAKARVKAVRRAVGPDIPVSIDMGCAFAPSDCARLLECLDKEYGLNFAEQPLHAYDVAGHQTLRAMTKVPLTGDQSGMSLQQMLQYMRLGVFDNFHCLLTRIGGISRAVKYCDMLETAHLNYQICNMDNSIAAAAGAHFAVSRTDRGGRFYDELGLYLYLHGTYDTKSITDDIVKEQAMVIENGILHVPKGPGLGVELDEEMLKRYAAPGVSPIVVK